MNEENKKLLKELGLLQKEKKALDIQLKLEAHDQLTEHRIKRHKAMIENKISMIQAIVYPDIIA
ncbi:MAG: hypothetical protein AB8U25_05930 [Rickettsiales endosymbiont of Dermacentor nuttalli]